MKKIIIALSFLIATLAFAETPKPGDDEPEVTMTDLEKALGLDRAR